ncbi:cupin domain-containing protein [Pinibacter aurantiacus]|uniref:Cupin domain-containing protein n=1 Tax=Pinibacter aurantiacus TaxID=2851599 RepID=A0A9E2S817_9BACT|nr:hypothetical protein [Pinibacter aurantiacus]MBV4357596.1 hypothetical protein [Pinibacter aurantiacus]
MDSPVSRDPWPYPDSLDALIAAPQHHKLLFENEFVRVLDTLIPPGETTAIHTHRYPASTYILSWSDFVRFDDNGNVMLDTRTLAKKPGPGAANWVEALPPHALQNVGTQDMHVISVEQKITNLRQ